MRQSNRQCPGFIYTIKSGDTLYSLANRYNTTVRAILQNNPELNPNNLVVGQQICLPSKATPGSCPGGFLHTVTINDTFYSIARRYNISLTSLLNANPGIDPDTLQIGQRICIPTTPPPAQECPGRLYTIQAGDTFISLARRFGYTLDALIAANPQVNPSNLQIGQQICLPPAPGGGPFACYGGSIYRVKPGDTLYSIASRFGISYNRLVQANPQIENPANISIGEPICIPG